MGIDFSHCDAHWSYSGFNKFRRKLAREININLDEMEGFENYLVENPPPGKPWDSIDDPIVPFLHHSDCDGILTPAFCESIAPRLRELVKDWPDMVPVTYNWVHPKADLGPPPPLPPGYENLKELANYDKTNALKLAEGMEAAAAKNENLRFC